MLTRFQALVAKLSLLEVYPNYGTYEGDAGTVVGMMHLGGRLSVQVEFNSTAVAWYTGEGLEPSQALIRLIEDGAYVQYSHMWHGSIPPTPLPGKRINYEPNDREMCGICRKWMSHEQYINHSHGMDK